MDNNNESQTSPRRLISYSEKRRTTKLKTIKIIYNDNLSNNNSVKNQKDKQDEKMINLQTGEIMGKLYKKQMK